MSTHALPSPAASGLVLADAWASTRARSATLVVGGTLVTALMAQLVVPVPGSPVPITGLTLALVVVAASLGPVRGLASMGLYLAAGLVGLPFFSAGGSGFAAAFGATGGYLMALLPAAYLIGLAAKHGADRRVGRALLLFLAAQGLVFAIGVPWLAAVTGMNASQALAAGLYPFVLGGIVKAVVAALAVPAAWQLVARGDARR